MENNKFLTVAEAAAMLGTKEGTIRVYITTGRLESVIKDGRRMIAADEIRRYIRDKEKFFQKMRIYQKKMQFVLIFFVSLYRI